MNDYDCNPQYVDLGNGNNRSSIPEDETQRIVKDVYERLVWATPERRAAALKAVAAIYQLEI